MSFQISGRPSFRRRFPTLPSFSLHPRARDPPDCGGAVGSGGGGHQGSGSGWSSFGLSKQRWPDGDAQSSQGPQPYRAAGKDSKVTSICMESHSGTHSRSLTSNFFVRLRAFSSLVGLFNLAHQTTMQSAKDVP